MHRYNKCYDIIKNFDENTETEKWMWILIWLRYSYQRQLDWQRNYNTRPSLLSGAMNRLSNEVTNKYAKIFQKEKLYRNLYYSQASLIKGILSQLGKGTGDGQRIRDEILHIMHRNGIPETPMNNFYEQWHQKLHNNTTPDDIIICEALLNFLYSGNIEDYRKTLKAGGISKERLASYERKITAEPWHNRNYINDFQNEALNYKEGTFDLKPLDDLNEKVMNFLDKKENAPDEYFKRQMGDLKTWLYSRYETFVNNVIIFYTCGC